MNENWFSNFDIQTTDFEGSINLKNPLIKNIMNKLFIESKVNDQYSNLSIESFLLEIFSTIKETKEKGSKKPVWVKDLQELLFEEQIDYSLKNLSSILKIHPVHLSREFSRYFGTSLGNYIRIIKVNQYPLYQVGHK